MRVVALVVAGLGLWGFATVAMACSVTEGFVRSSSYEMVERADAVVVAVADSQSGDAEAFDTAVTFRIERAFKGLPPATIVMDRARLGRIEPSDPNDLTVPHPETMHGACSRYTFQRGVRYVLFLREGEGGDEPVGWYAMRPTFWRGTEDYAGPDSAWARAVNLYIDIQRDQPDRMAALDALTARLPLLEAPGASATDRQIALDIRDHLSSLSPDKPTPYLVRAYEALERGESPRFPVRSPEADREGGMAAALTDFIFDVRRPEFDLERAKTFVLMSLANGEHPDALPLFERLLAHGPESRTLGLSIRYLSKSGQYRRAFEIVETEVMRRLGGLPDEEASALARDVAGAMYGPGYVYGQDNEAWRTEPYVLARWPETALSLYWDMERRGSEMGFSAEIAHLRPADYRTRPEVTFALAASYDEQVLHWAIAETDRLMPAANWLEDEDPAWLPLRALVMTSGEERDAALIRVWCIGRSGQIMLVQTLALWGDTMDEDWLKRMLVTPGLNEEALDQVRKALAVVYGRHASERRGLFRRELAYEAIKGSLTGGAIESYLDPVTPIRCTPAT